MIAHDPEKMVALRAEKESSLKMSDWLLVISIGLCALWGMDPFHAYLDKRALIKHVPAALFMLALAMHSLSRRLFPSRESASPPRSSQQRNPPNWWIALGMWVIGGSLYTRYVLNTEETFFNLGAYIGIVFVTAPILRTHPSPIRLLNAYITAIILFTIFGSLHQAVLFDRSFFHELQFVTVPIIVLFATITKSKSVRVFIPLWLMLSFILAPKNTTALVAVACFLYIIILTSAKKFAKIDPFRAFTSLYLTALIITCALGSAIAVRLTFSEYFPSGNPTYRLLTYQLAWDRFMRSPIIGQNFTGAGSEKFTGFEVASSTQKLPTHSDLLDIAAQGGCLGVVLFSLGFYSLAVTVRRSLCAMESEQGCALNPYIHWLSATALSSIIVMAFNPVILQPGKAFMLWFSLGALLGLAQRVQDRVHSVAITPP